jgi:hypothetical protein
VYSAIKNQGGRVCLNVDGRLTRLARVGREQSVTLAFSGVGVDGSCQLLAGHEPAYTVDASSFAKTFTALRGQSPSPTTGTELDGMDLDSHDASTCFWTKTYTGEDNNVPAYGWNEDPDAPPDTPVDCSSPYWFQRDTPLMLRAFARALVDPYFGSGDFGIAVEARTWLQPVVTSEAILSGGLLLFLGFKAIRLCDVLDNAFTINNALTVPLEDETHTPNTACRGSGGSCVVTFNY